ncbi:MAG: ankyrin repeat domain-containing protein [Candidatus Cardinium sp.]|uniref:ankyrin repeat domain-containing protein n=1 Tax=Cardinium endosymbiont of Dermatophagoides farinae TaxID=2597823 RepID=UPI0016435639|nr:ankyrin repeat domain-containing protein [Cardinium endosymbiont of Dermatophagoides farinae]UWW96506.1 MAG: ankyrin repeat domain-containing protein [Candidatus Cardinium sp.]
MVPWLRSITKPTKKNYAHDAQPSNYPDNYPIQGESSYPLHTAVSQNELIKVQIILNEDKLKYKNTDRPCIRVNQTDNEGYLPIHWALNKKFSYKTGRAADNNLKILKLLLKYPNSSQGDKQKMTVLHWATKNNLPNSVALILEQYRNKLPDFINQKDQDGLTALHYAVDKDEKEEYRKKRIQILNTLLNDPKVQITKIDKDGKTALHQAVINNNLEAVEAILEYCRNKPEDRTNQKDQEGFTPLHYAVDKDQQGAI